jgi:hypothetical protein
MADLLQQKVQTLLKEAAAAHHEYEREELSGVRDEQWANWYADHLLANGLDGLLASQMDADELSAALSEISAAQQAAGNTEDWAAYSAAALLTRMTTP